MFRRNLCLVVIRCSLPNNLTNQVLLTKDFIAEESQIRLLIVIDADEYHAVSSEELFCELEAWVHEREPRGV